MAGDYLNLTDRDDTPDPGMGDGAAYLPPRPSPRPSKTRRAFNAAYVVGYFGADGPDPAAKRLAADLFDDLD